MAIEVYGIDLGTTYSVLTRIDENGTPRVIPNNAEGKDTLASAVFFPEDGDPVVGEQAKEFRDTEKDRVIECAKRYIGREGAEGKKYEIDGVVYDPIDISALYLKRIKAYAAEQGYNVENVVITCPAYFKDPQREATKQAAVLAGMTVLGIVNEPTAAALAYCKDEYPENRKIMVYDLGGGTFDVSIILFTKHEDDTAQVEVIDSMGNDQLGGKDWDAILSEIIAERVAEEAGISVSDIDEDLELKAQINSKCEELKIGLTTMPKKTIVINASGDKVRVSVTREEFEERTQSKVNETTDFVKALLEKCNFTPNDIDVVLLVGGSTFMPMIPAAVKAIFPEDKVRSYEPNLAVAKGAVIAAKLMIEQPKRDPQPLGTSEESDSFFPDDDLSVPIGMVLKEQPLTDSYGVTTLLGESKEPVINNLLFIGDPATSKAVGIYGPVYDNQESVIFSVYRNASRETYIPVEVDSEFRPINTPPLLQLYFLGKLILPLPENSPSTTEIEVTLRHEASGLQISANNLTTQEHADAFIEFNSDGVKTREELEAAKRYMEDIRVRPELDE